MTITHPNIVEFCNTDILVAVHSTNFAQPNFRFAAEIIVAGTSYITYLKPDAAGYATFNISRFVRTLFALAVYVQPGAVLQSVPLIGSYQYNIREEYGTQRTEQARSATFTRYALPGAAPTNFVKNFTEQGKFITNQPRSKYISTTNNELLYFYNAGTVFSINARVEYFTPNGGTIITAATQNIYYSEDKGIYALSCGFTQLQLNLLPNAADITHYTVQIVDGQGNTMSELFLFRLIKNNFTFKREFIFRNSFGMYDILRTYSSGEESETYERYTSETSVKRINYYTSSRQRLSVNTGFHLHQTDEANLYSFYIRDFLMSNEIYLVQNNLLHALNITNTESLRRTDGRYLLQRNIEFEYVNAEDYFAIDFATETPYYHDFNHDINHD